MFCILRLHWRIWDCRRPQKWEDYCKFNRQIKQSKIINL